MVQELLRWPLLWSGSRDPGVIVQRYLHNEAHREVIQSLTAEDFNHPAEVKEWAKYVSSDNIDSISSKIRKARK